MAKHELGATSVRAPGAVVASTVLWLLFTGALARLALSRLVLILAFFGMIGFFEGLPLLLGADAVAAVAAGLAMLALLQLDGIRWARAALTVTAPVVTAAALVYAIAGWLLRTPGPGGTTGGVAPVVLLPLVLAILAPPLAAVLARLPAARRHFTPSQRGRTLVAVGAAALLRTAGLGACAVILALAVPVALSAGFREAPDGAALALLGAIAAILAAAAVTDFVAAARVRRGAASGRWIATIGSLAALAALVTVARIAAPDPSSWGPSASAGPWSLVLVVVLALGQSHLLALVPVAMLWLPAGGGRRAGAHPAGGLPAGA